MKRILTVFTALVAMAQAEIPAVAFKDVTKHFRDKHYSPVMGRWALDSGFIYNLRHFGLFTPTMGKNPDGTERRLYDSDIPQDAMMELLLKLFPSSAGPLASESTGISNFGKRATIQDVADMLRFVKEVRAIVSQSQHLQRDPTNDWGLAKTFKKYEFLRDLREIISSSIRLEYNSEKTEFPSTRKSKQQLYRKELGERFNKDVSKQYSEIEDARLKEIEENRLYPLYTTEQIILAFFVHRFNDKAAIYDLMQALGDEFVDGTLFKSDETSEKEVYRLHALKTQFTRDLWTIDTIKNYPTKTDLDYVFFNTHHDINAPIPFANGLNPISNGNCPYIKVTESGKKIDPARGSFADCHETAIRQLFTIGFYDAKSKTFKIPDGITNPYLRNFFEHQTPTQANNGSSEMRERWNLVIGGLPEVRYLKESNEIDSGFVNLIKTMRHILGVKKDFLPKDKEEVIEELIYLFKAMNPDLKEIDIEISGFSPSKRGVDDEFYGNAVIEITNAYDQGFSFTFHESLGHADIQNPNWEASGISMNPTQISDGILDKRNPKTGLHKLLATQEFADERQRIDRVKDFNQEVKIQHIPIINRMMDLTVDDQANLDAAAEAILPIIQKGFILHSTFDIANESRNDNLWNELFNNQNEAFLNNLEKKGYINLNQNRYDKLKSNISKVRKVNIKNDIDKLDLSQANALQEIKMFYNKTIDTLALPNSPFLKKVKLLGRITNALNLDLSNAIALEELTLKQSGIGTFIMPNSPFLKKVELRQITADTLDLSQAKALETFTFGPDSEAKILILPNPSTSLKEVSLFGTIATADLSQSTSLAIFNLSDLSKIETLILPNSALLKKIELSGNIINADLSRMIALEEISITNHYKTFNPTNKVEISTLILPISKRELGDALDKDNVVRVRYVNPDGTMEEVVNATAGAVAGSSVGRHN